MKKIVMAIMTVMVLTSGAMADEIVLDTVSLYSRPSTLSGTKYNDLNFGGGYLYTINQYIGVGGGVYLNSFDKVSVYGGTEITYPLTQSFAFGGSVGVVTGYQDEDPKRRSVMPAVAALVKFKIIDNISASIEYTDTRLIHKGGVGVAHLQFRYSF